MAMMGPTQRGSGGRSRRRSAPMAEINVTPFVDVMLVLLIVFMVAATTLSVGVAIDLPKTDAKALPAVTDPLEITVTGDGTIFVQEDAIVLDALVPRLVAIAENGYEERIVLRGDQGATWNDMMTVMARINAAGFTNLNLASDPLEQ